MRKIFATACLLAMLSAWPAAPAQTKVQGVLIDKMCSSKAETRVVPGGRLEGGMLEAYVHDRKCLLMPDCKKSGYGIFTYEQKYLTFDAAGNQKALALIQSAKKDDDFRVEVTGEINGTTIKVTSIKLL